MAPTDSIVSLLKSRPWTREFGFLAPPLVVKVEGRGDSISEPVVQRGAWSESESKRPSASALAIPVGSSASGVRRGYFRSK